MKKVFTTLVLLLACTAMSFADDTYGIVGDFSDWDTDLVMTQGDGSTYTLEIKGFVAEAKTYQYKVRKNGAWGEGEIPSSGNNEYAFVAAGKYDLKFTADVSAGTLSMAITSKYFTGESTVPGETLWYEETPKEMDWGGNAITLPSALFASAKVGDKIIIDLARVPVGSIWDCQVVFTKGDWSGDIEKFWVGLPTDDVWDTNNKTAEYVITGEFLTYLKANNLVVRGPNYAIKKIALDTNTGLSGSDYSIWVGNETLSWTQVVLSKSHFQNAAVGQYIRLSYEDSGANIQLKYGWSDADYPAPTKGIGTAILEITSDILTHLQENDFIINAAGITLKQVELVDDNSDYYLVMDKNDGNSWIVDSKMTEATGTYTATASGTKWFAFAPYIALNADQTKIAFWDEVVRPNTVSGNFIVNLMNYSSTDELTKAVDKVWEVAPDVDDVNITFVPATNNYEFTCEGSVTIGETGLATYSNDNMYQVEGAKVNFVTVSGKVATLVEQEDNVILPGKEGAGKGAGIILSATPGTKAKIKSVAYDATPIDAVAAGNLLAGSGDDAEYDISDRFSDSDLYTAYILANHESNLGFYKVDLSKKRLGAYKAFLAAPRTAEAPSFIGFDLNSSDVNAIESIETAKEGVKNAFNLAGQRVATPTKGLYIVNGKKVVLK